MKKCKHRSFYKMPGGHADIVYVVWCKWCGKEGYFKYGETRIHWNPLPKKYREAQMKKGSG